MSAADAGPAARSAPVRHAGIAKLGFACDPEGETYLAEQFAAYPFHVCRPHRYDGDPRGMATVTLQSLSGGIYQGEQLWLSVDAAPAAQAHVTTQASTIVHSMEQDSAEHRAELVAGAGTLLEYLPSPTILFPRARFASRISVVAHPQASVLLSESFLVHDPAGAGGAFDWLLADLSISGPDGRPWARDRFRVRGCDFRAAPVVGADRSRAQGAFYAITRAQPADALVATLREGLEACPGLYAGASELPGECGAWARVVASDAVALSGAMAACWQAARVLLTGAPAPARRK